jgi:uncharacterized protein (TIGR03084 family)
MLWSGARACVGQICHQDLGGCGCETRRIGSQAAIAGKELARCGKSVGRSRSSWTGISIRSHGGFTRCCASRDQFGGSGHADLEAAAGAAQPRSVLLEQWRAGRAEVAMALRDVPPDHAFPWYGSQLSAALMVPLRLMETWAHGQDVFDAVGVSRRATSRLRHVAALGVVGRELSFHAAQLPSPSEPFRVELTGPDGRTWAWGPKDAAQRVQGSALDFCLRVTQRRSRAQTDLTAVGRDARKWLDIARVFL